MTNQDKQRARAIAEARVAEAIKNIDRLEKELRAAKDDKRRIFIEATINVARKELGLDPLA